MSINLSIPFHFKVQNYPTPTKGRGARRGDALATQNALTSRWTPLNSNSLNTRLELSKISVSLAFVVIGTGLQ